MTKAQQKKVDARINRAYVQSCSNIEVSMMDIPKIFAVGRTAVAAGADDEVLKTKIREFVDTIRKN